MTASSPASGSSSRAVLAAERADRLRRALESALSPTLLEIRDDGAAHAGHAGARQGGHFFVRVVSEQFVGRTLRERHQLVYAAAGDLMHSDIHALSIDARLPA
jgi:BolA family transcriptional regulator, general stress-responsive regulator